MSNCDICGFEYRKDPYIGIVCSEYCDTLTANEKEKYKDPKIGEWTVRPCMKCGIAMEDEYCVPFYCSSCAKNIKNTKMLDLLQRSLVLLKKYKSKEPKSLVEEIEKL